MLVVLNSLFFLFLSFLLLSFLFYFVLLPFLLNAYFQVMFFSRNSYYRVSEIPLFSAQQGVLYRACRDWYLLFQPLTAFVWVSLLTTYWSLVVQLPPLTCAGCVAPLCQTKKAILFVACCGFFYPLQCVCSLSLSLMASTWWFQLILTSFGWHVIPAEHFPQKSLSKNPRIGFFPLPTVRA